MGDAISKLMMVDTATFITCQGEGPFTGTPSLFIRLSGCNLRCQWKTQSGVIQCDTPYASYTPERKMIGIDSILENVRDAVTTWGVNHVVITGGEPTIQPVEHLTGAIRDHFPEVVQTIETNGTTPKTLPGVTWISLSPKIPGIVGQETEFTYSLEQLALQVCRMRYMNPQATTYLKVVIGRPEDSGILKLFLKAVKAEAIKADLRWEPGVLVMPVGQTNEELEQSARLAWNEAIHNGWRYCDRVHVRVFGKERNR